MTGLAELLDRIAAGRRPERPSSSACCPTSWAASHPPGAPRPTGCGVPAADAGPGGAVLPAAAWHGSSLPYAPAAGRRRSGATSTSFSSSRQPPRRAWRWRASVVRGGVLAPAPSLMAAGHALLGDHRRCSRTPAKRQSSATAGLRGTCLRRPRLARQSWPAVCTTTLDVHFGDHGAPHPAGTTAYHAHHAITAGFLRAVARPSGGDRGGAPRSASQLDGGLGSMG